MARLKKGVRGAVEWYGKNREKYDALVSNLRELIRSLLTEHSIAFVDVQGRSKSLESFTEKINKKAYENPIEDVTDLAGLRIITLIESDISRVNNIVSSAFRVYTESSIDKSEALGSDRVGYRSLHLICDLGEDRLRLPEFRRFSSCRFEVQIRTSLQHAWAEIEHDRGYKLRGELPSHLKRKFSLLAGLLELADTQFDELSQAIDRYAEEVAKKASAGDLNIELNSSSVLELLSIKFGEALQDSSSPNAWIELIEELKGFGVCNLKDLDALITPDVHELMLRANPDLVVPGLVRDAMLLNDIDKYFSRAWGRHWGVLDLESYRVLSEIYGRKKIDYLMRKYQISWEWDFENEDESYIENEDES